MKKLSALIIFIMMWMTSMPAAAQNPESKIKTLFVYNFIRYTQWPDNNGDVKIGILGNDKEIVSAFKDMAAKKSSSTANITVEVFTDVSQSSNYQLVYLPENSSQYISSLSNLKKTLVISEKPGMTRKGSDINFIKKDGKIRFELNKSSVDKSLFKVAGRIVSLAIVV